MASESQKHAPYARAAARQYLDPGVLAGIRGLPLRARLAVEGYFAGRHSSPDRGVSVEFVDHRAYAQGDDIRHIDWKVLARTDKAYIKRYQQESNLTCVVAVDASASMQFRSASAPMAKYAYAQLVAAALAYLALRQRDAIGAAVFSDRVIDFVPPSNAPAQWKALVDGLERSPAGRATGIRRSLLDLAERLDRRSLVVVLSDLFDDQEEIVKALKRLRYDGHEVIVLNLWDPAELTFAFDVPTRFRDLEGEHAVLVEPLLLRESYLQELERMTTDLRRACRAMQIDYERFDTGCGLEKSIRTYLATRNARQRQRTSRVMRA